MSQSLSSFVLDHGFTACPRSVERMERASLSVKLFLSILALLLAESVNGLETKGVIG